MKFMTVLIFSQGVGQPGPGRRASNLQFMETSALLHGVLVLLCSDHGVSVGQSLSPRCAGAQAGS